MPYTHEFQNLLRDCKKRYGYVDEAINKAFEKAQEEGIPCFRKRRKRGTQNKFKIQQNATKMQFIL